MAGLLPVVRHLLVCEDLIYDSAKPRSVSLKNLLGNIRSGSHPPYPPSAILNFVFACNLPSAEEMAKFGLESKKRTQTRLFIKRRSSRFRSATIRLGNTACPFAFATCFSHLSACTWSNSGTMT
jgi:hypothetical protein